MNRRALATALLAGSAVAGATYVLRARRSPAFGTGVISIVIPEIDIGVAEEVLACMERLPGDRVTLLLHTLGGCAASCALIANALRQFERSVAVVPYLAFSGGTLIALSARQLHMGPRASLSAVDPILDGRRARHLGTDGPGRAAQEYEAAIRRSLRESLVGHLNGAGEATVERAMGVFMGEQAPHEWPIRRSEVAALGLSVHDAAPSWAATVDAHRRRWR